MAVWPCGFIVGRGMCSVAAMSPNVRPSKYRRRPAGRKGPPSRSTNGRFQFAEAAFGGADFARLGAAFGGGGQGFAGRVEVAGFG